MNTNHRVALITGANKGIGFEIARQLGEAGVTVLIGARDAKRGAEAAARLVAQGITAAYVPLDVTNITSFGAAALLIEERHTQLDILINNAGIWKIKEDGMPSVTTPSVIRETMETNFIGLVAVTQAMLPLLRRSDSGRIVNLSSTLGSLNANSDPTNPYYSTRLLAYNASKTAVNMFTVQLAQELRHTSIAVNAVSPGFVKTDLTAGNGFKESAEGAAAPVHFALLESNAITGRFADANGDIPW
ncbi:dehydrogenase [Acetobacter nitrogenifigens DSM 23921 = NBRC 105050]|uniref:Short-chain dehydrogenase n=1 Tax=Acetobacter nitrogenifigens DSM 23921 = NBRC 105050 TaxID=1120919 RepID=A0A511XF52_9PROT|nr:SDR family oxidoreductase [Acetobacter nitrogenifigens]GBQ97039.1 dehydrogenase [Acetobacter nitrogenifigens DSM 23921 = NBRC 105050]GEN61579.1 short-chain dehydrogenase [Acetobacter nitrogenifigens DSM 23921 = NBRC 105050]